MQEITIACPACGHSEDVREDDVPAGPIDIECPQCQGAFTFTREAVAALPNSGTSTRPPAPPRMKPPAPKPAAGRPLMAPRAKVPPRPRRLRSAWAIVAAVLSGLMLLVGAWMYVFKITPILTEKVLIAALFSRVPLVQQMAIKALQDYPTKHVAIALVAFINLKNMQEVEDPKRPWAPEERDRRRLHRLRDLRLAERATETLCLLTGQSFGTYFKLEQYGHSWGSLSEDKWPTVLWEIDTWALRAFGPGDLPHLSRAVPGAPAQPAGAAGGGQAR